MLQTWTLVKFIYSINIIVHPLSANIIVGSSSLVTGKGGESVCTDVPGWTRLVDRGAWEVVFFWLLRPSGIEFTNVVWP